MTPEALAKLHSRAFAGQGRGWSGEEFLALLQSPHVFVVGDMHAFALGRTVAEEAELLTLATVPEKRRSGMGRAVLQAFEAEAIRRGAHRLFLEVAEDNLAAVALYLDVGYDETARRARYYERSGGARVDALVFQKNTE